MKKIIYSHYIFIPFIILFLFLLFKNPFSEKNLIANFEPFPDAIYYVASAKNFIAGHGFTISREGRYFTPPIPPLYSIVLSPSFLVTDDPRAFYFINVIIALISLSLFYIILVRLKFNKLICTLLLLLYVTNYFLYWMPTLAMAENLIILLYLGAILILISDLIPFNIFIMSMLGIGFYATKYASISLTASFFAAYCFKFIHPDGKKKILYKKFMQFIFYVLFFSSILFLSEEISKGTSPLHSLNIVKNSLIKTNLESQSAETIKTSSTWFSIDYINLNIWHYINSLIGKSEKFLWDSTPIIPVIVGVGGILGLAIGLFIKQRRLLCIALSISLITSIIFMSTLYTYDIRYIYFAIPTLLIGFGILIHESLIKFSTGLIKTCIIFSTIFLILFFSITNAIKIKSQISLNLRYAETPWYYISILKMNEFFSKDKIINDKKPIVVSALPPYLVDFFSNGNYTLLPLSYQQEFRNMKETVWGLNDYSDLPKLYESYMQKGFSVYLAKYGLGNEGYTNHDFQVIIGKFNTELIFKGCFEQCNIYKLNLKNETGE